MSVLQHEGTFPVMARTLPVLVGSHYRTGYLARPDRAGRFPTVLVVPRIDVIGAHEKFLARRLARTGIAVVAIQISASDRAGDPYSAIDDEEAMRVLDEVHDWVASADWSLSDRFGLVGLGLGGRFALIEAAHRGWVASVAVVATPLEGDEDRRHPISETLGHIGVPVMGLYGANDRLTPATTVDGAQRANVSGNWLLYAGVGNGFDDEGSGDYDRSAAEDAILRLGEFFISTLPSAQPLDVG